MLIVFLIVSSCFFLGKLKEDNKLDRKDKFGVGDESKKTDGKDNILLHFWHSFLYAIYCFLNISGLF